MRLCARLHSPASSASPLVLCVCSKAEDVVEISACARLRAPLLWVLNIDSFFGRDRPEIDVVDEEFLGALEAIREESWEENAREVDDDISLPAEGFLGRGMP